MNKIKRVLMGAIISCLAILPLTAQTPDYALDLTRLSPWDETATKVTKTNAITFMKANSGVTLTLSDTGDFNAEKYNSLELTNKATAICFTITIKYGNGEETKAYVEDGITRMSIPLKDDAKKSIKQIDFQDKDVAGSLKIYSLTFKEEPGTSMIYTPDSPVLDLGPKVKLNADISGLDYVKSLKVGINMGNTFDAIGNWELKMGNKSETLWGNPKTTKDTIHMYKEAGYTVLRMPVTWANHLIDDNYTIDPIWMARVKTVVNWAMDEGLYVILNEHHSVRDNMNKPLRHGEGYRVGKGDEEESEQFLEAIWTQIAAAFNNGYDEHLMFETMNEPRNTAHNHCWTPNQASGGCVECKYDFELCNKYNQICLDAIRKSGGNNANRFVLIPSLCSDSGAVLNNLFVLPKDSAKDKLIVTFHDYIMGSGPEYLVAMFTRVHQIKLDDLFSKLQAKFVNNGIPVIMGETGATKQIALDQREAWGAYCFKSAKDHGILPVLWDDGGNFSCFDRTTSTNTAPTFVKAMVDACN